MNLIRVLEKREYDIIHVHNVLFLPLVRLITNKPVVVTYHGNFYKDQAGIAFNKSRGTDVVKLYQNSVSYVDCATFLTPSMMQQYKDDLGLEPKFSKIIPNGINSSNFVYSDLLRSSVRKQLGFSDEDFVFITVGSVQERKGQERFIRLIKELDWDVKYLIVGRGPDSEKISKLINQLGVESKVTLIDFVKNNELNKYFSGADAYAHVSTAEGQAMSALEAKCSGLPLLVASEIVDTMGNYIDESTYIIDFKENGYELLGKLKKSADSFNRLQIDSEQFSWASIAQQYNEFYDECLHG